MSDNEIGRAIYLTALAVAIGGYYLVSHRRELHRTLRYVLLWGVIFVGAIAAVGLFEDVKNRLNPRQMVEGDQGRVILPKDRDGHYYVTIVINKAPVDFVVDTGATSIVLSQADARRIGLDPQDLVYLSQAMTANGMVRTAPVRLDEVILGPFTDFGLRAYVNEGQMDGSLLGMEYLSLFERVEITGDRMILER